MTSARAQSWVSAAGSPTSDFPLENIPFGVFSASGREAHPGVAIGDQILDLVSVAEAGLLDDATASVVDDCARVGALNPLLAAGSTAIRDLRIRAQEVLVRGSSAEQAGASLLVAMRDAELHVPARVGDYTDFYASVHHATNVGSMFRPDNPLLPNYKWVPIGYHGRASSIVRSGTAVRRPSGQTRDDAQPAPVFGPTRRLDYELEVGLFIAGGNAQGTSISIADAEAHIGGLCLVNDWSARDVQAWEYQPLGPFLAKNFSTTVSPWMVTLDALAPFRAPEFPRAPDDPRPLPHLASDENSRSGAFDITLEVLISTARMREVGVAPERVSIGSFTSMYWTLAQLVAHHTSNGCNLVAGDLLASGTVSGSTKESRGCLLERTWRGSEPLSLSTGETRRFLEDGDEVILRGWCERSGTPRIGFGECRGTIIPS